MKQTQLKLNNGVEMPALGLGVFQNPPRETAEAVESALRAGYRLIDTAAAYGNEAEVGEGLRKSGVKRSDVFLVSKLWISDYGFEEALVGFNASLRRLGTDYVDLYLLHQPMPNEFDKTIGAYKALESALKDKRGRAIGVSNFSAQHLERLMSKTEITPSVNQIELHPFFVQKDLRDVHRKLGITTQAWSPIGGIHVYRPKDPGQVLNALTHPTVTALATKHQKTPAQIVLRWQIEIGNCAIPKSVHPARIVENLDVFDFSLSAFEVEEISKLDTGVRAGPDPEAIDTKTFTKKIDNTL